MPDPEDPIKTAVIVEDDADVRHLLVAVFESAGFSTVSVGNGIDGVRAVLAYKPMITTLDVSMPGIDGIEAARRIRAASNDTYIIMVTAMGEESDVVLGLSAGADEYILKPFRPREFRARLDAYLRRPRVPQSPPPRPRESVGPSFVGARPATGVLPALDDGRGDAGNVPWGRRSTDAPSYPGQHPARRAEDRRPPEEPRRPAEQHPVAKDTPSSRRERRQERAGVPEWRAVPPGASGEGDGATERGRDAHNAYDNAYDGAIIAEIDAPGTDLSQGVSRAEWMTHRDLRVDPESRTAKVGAANLDLSHTEFELLTTLLSSQRRIRSKADLTLVLRGESYVTSYYVGEADKQAIEAHMTNLLRKLGDIDPRNPRYIESVRGVGWRLTPDR